MLFTLPFIIPCLHYFQFLDFERQCFDCRCILDSNGWALGGSGHTEEECLESCKQNDGCKFASISPSGYCHMTPTCNEKGSSGWIRFKKTGMKYIIYVLVKFFELFCDCYMNYI